MSLQVVYWLSLAVGLGFLAFSVLFDAFDFLDVDVGGNDIDVAPVFAAGVAAFGGGGLIGIHAFGFGALGSIVTGGLTGLAFAIFTALVFVLLHRMESRKPFTLDDLVGLRARCSLPLGPGQVGRVTVHFEGMTRSIVATSAESIAAGEEVMVADVVGNQLTVVRADTLGLPGDRT